MTDDGQERQELRTVLALGISFGLPGGIVLGLFVFDNIGLGLAAGVLSGVAAGSVVQFRGADREDPSGDS